MLNVHIDLQPEDDVLNATWEIAERHMLTFYDAAYLELSIRLRLPLASSEQRPPQRGEKTGNSNPLNR